MTDVYERVGIKKKPVVTNLEKLYGIKVKACKVTINNGERVSGYQVQ